MPTPRPSSALLPIGGVGPGLGSLSLAGRLPTFFSGSFGLQAFVLDPASPIGMSASPALVVDTQAN